MAKKEEYVLVDGYNIIFAWENLQKIAAKSLEDARLKLIEILSDYQGATGKNVIVVFDAHRVKKSAATMEKHENITVVYTKEAETADHYIERATYILAKENRVRVATSDTLEQIIIMSQGAIRVSAQAFWLEIQNVKQRYREQYIENKPVKKNLLLDNLDAKTAALLEKMRRGM